MSNTTLVLGATGKSGRRLVPLLRERGHEVRSASRRPGERRTLFDWDRLETHRPALDGVDAVYLVPPDFVEDATPALAPFLELAKKMGVRKVVFVSSLGVEFPNEAPSSGRHRMERAVCESGIGWTLLRPTGFDQNFSEAFHLPQIREQNRVVSATGDGRVGFVDAADIARVAERALTEATHDGATYAITGPEALTFAETAEIIGRVSGRRVTHHAISSEEFRGMLEQAGVPLEYAALLTRNQEAIRNGFGARVTDVVERVTKRAPTTFREYAEGAANAWQHVIG